MSRLTLFSLCAIVVTVIAAFIWDYSHTKNALVLARADLDTAQHNFDQCAAARQHDAAYATAMRHQASASQQNCAQALLNTQTLFELALPPQHEISFDNPPMRKGAADDAVGLSVEAAPVNNPPKADDYAFTQFLNTW